MGAGATMLGQSLLRHRDWISRVGGVIIIIFGLYLLGVLNLGFLSRERRFHVADKPVGYFGTMVVGVAFVVALLIKLGSPGPVFFRQWRHGFNQRPFRIFKFRTMIVAEDGDTVTQVVKNDPRVTKIGRFLRRTRLDELPQLWNVFKGDMSLIGPRPERPEFVERLTRAIPFYGERHLIRPGLTGWAQVRYTYGASVEDAMEKLQYDLFYLKNMSLALDLVIAFETAKTVILRRGAA